MARLAVIALDKAEHRVLAEVWKFFPFEGDIQYYYAYPGTKRAPEAAGHPNLISRRFAGKAADAVTGMKAFLEEEGVDRFCFASLAAFEIWREAFGLEAATLFSSAGLSLADISGLGRITQAKLAALSSQAGKPLAALRSEGKEIRLSKGGQVYEDFQAFQKASSGEVLLTRNRDLLSALRGSRGFAIAHFHGESRSANLGIGDGRADFTGVLNGILLAARASGGP
ncbi:MAG: hypothetical protein ACP5F3_06580, partial [Candidatus Syntrophosphaera sp.]